MPAPGPWNGMPGCWTALSRRCGSPCRQKKWPPGSSGQRPQAPPLTFSGGMLPLGLEENRPLSGSHQASWGREDHGSSWTSLSSPSPTHISSGVLLSWPCPDFQSSTWPAGLPPAWAPQAWGLKKVFFSLTGAAVKSCPGIFQASLLCSPHSHQRLWTQARPLTLWGWAMSMWPSWTVPLDYCLSTRPLG